MTRFLFLIKNSLKHNVKTFKGNGFYSTNRIEDRECEEDDRNRACVPQLAVHSFLWEDSRVWKRQAWAEVETVGRTDKKLHEYQVVLFFFFPFYFIFIEV